MASEANESRSTRAVPWRLAWAIPVVLLLLPWLTNAPWTASDYIFAGAVFGIVGGIFELTVRKKGNKWYRGGVAVALATAFLLIWINGAVGIIGNEHNPANLAFLVVVMLAAAGAIAARFEAGGMMRAMAVAAAAQMLIALVTLVYHLGAAEPPFFPRLPILISIFAAMWLFSALLFRRAAQ